MRDWGHLSDAGGVRGGNAIWGQMVRIWGPISPLRGLALASRAGLQLPACLAREEAERRNKRAEPIRKKEDRK